jgi:hypothetical protein
MLRPQAFGRGVVMARCTIADGGWLTSLNSAGDSFTIKH